MTSVTMVTNDSAALHTTKVDGRNVKEVQGYPASQTVKEQVDATSAPRQKANQSPQQRRKQARRQQKESVMLDTRSGHDRRNVVDSQAVNSQVSDSQNDDTEETDKKTTGVDVYT